MTTVARSPTTSAFFLCTAFLLLLAAVAVSISSRKSAAMHDFEATLQNTTLSFSDHAAHYRTLLETIGPSAQDVLLAKLPATPRTHMLNHESGFYLFKTYGARGMTYCKNYFNGGCYHGFVEAALEEKGLGAIDEVVTACKGERSIEQARECTHGVGHAILIARGYAHLDQAAAECRETFSGSDTAIEDCDDGVFMENGFGGFSIPPEDRWFKKDDPLYPCTDPRIAGDSIARKACLFLQTQGTLQVQKYPHLDGNISSVVSLCTTLTDVLEQRYCYMGLARQVQARFVDNEHDIRTACGLFPLERIPRCLTHAAESAYAFGNRETGVALCLASEEPAFCFSLLNARINSTAEHTEKGRRAACKALPAPYVTSCLGVVDDAR